MPWHRRHYHLYLAVAWLMPLGVLSQIGLALFGIPLAIHAILGAVIGLLAFLLVPLVLAASTSRSQRVLARTLVGLIGIQPCLIALRPAWSMFAVVHEVNAFVILGVACALALDAEEAETNSRVRRPGMAGPDR